MLVKHCRFDFASVQDLTAIERQNFLEFFIADQEAEAEAIKESQNKNFRGR